MVRYALALLAVAALCAAGIGAHAQQAMPARVALVIGNGNYTQGALPNALHDAGLVAETLRGMGFEVTEGADLRQAELLAEFKNFAAKVGAGGPDTIAVFYFAGYGFTLEKDNLLVAADAVLEGDTDIALDTVRLADLLQPLSTLPARAKIVVLDAARALPFPMKDVKIAPGLRAVDAPPNTLIALPASPATIAADTAGTYGAYALAIAEMIRTGGFDIGETFTRIRTRTHQVTQGVQTPWHVSAIAGDALLAPPDPAGQAAVRAARPMNEIGADESYSLAIEADTLADYAEFARAFPQSVYAPRLLAMLRVRREALTWQRALAADTQEAYWTYVRRYPGGMYLPDAERRLARLSAPLLPPPVFEQVKFADVPAPVPNEPLRVESLPSAPPPPARLIAPRPALYANLAPPRESPQRGPRVGRSVLPVVSLPRATPAAATPAETRPPAQPARPRPAAPRAPQAAAPQPGAPPATAPRPQVQPPRSLAPPAQRPAPPRAAPTPPQCFTENGTTVCR